MKRSVLTPNVLIALTGTAVILLSVAGLGEIGSRAGPFERTVVPSVARLAVTGTFEARGATGTPGPGGVCVPPTGAAECAEAFFRVDLALAGLPEYEGDVGYVAFFVRGAGPVLLLGELKPTGPVHAVSYESSTDERGGGDLVVTLETDARTTKPGTLRVFAMTIRDQGEDEPYELPTTAETRLDDVTGTVRVAEIGMLSKSTTALGTVDRLNMYPGWTHHAWFESRIDGSFTHLGEWERDDGSGSASLDARVEQTRLEDQSRFFTTLEPADGGVASPGFPVFETVFPTG